MSNESHHKFMLMFRGTDWHAGLSPEEIQELAGQMMDWFKRLQDQGAAIAGNPLDAKGKIVSGTNGRVVTDGPFAESKEAIGGYFMLQADTLDEAVDIARQCPILAYGVKVEVRPVLEECPFAKAACAASQAKEQELAAVLS
jgi:hypothetical protein